nr:Ig-like domain-containing protein [Chloroflexota bacterium]
MDRRRLRSRVALSGLLSGLIALLGVLMPASTLAATPSLAGENFSGLNPQELQVSCDPSGTSTLTVRSSGTATGPYPGPYTETMTVTIGAQNGDDFSFEGVHALFGPVVTAQATFSINSSAGQVDGTKTLVGTGLGVCVNGQVVTGSNSGVTSVTGRFLVFTVITSYEARIVAPDGTYIDRGSAQTHYEDAVVAVLNGSGQCCIVTGTDGFSEFFYGSTGVVPAGPASVTLTPPDAVNTVGTNHTVTATVTNAGGGPVPNATVLFSTSGSTSASGSCTTDANGQCSFTYTGPQLPGADIITACADSNKNGVVDVGEPCGEATKAWVLPTSTAGQTTGGGQTLNSAGTDKIAFGYNAKSTTNGLNGNCTVVDPSPATNVKVKCLDVTSLVQTGTHATFFGN